MPTHWPSRVTDSAVASARGLCARPKSVTTARSEPSGDFVRITLADLKSRCTTPARVPPEALRSALRDGRRLLHVQAPLAPVRGQRLALEQLHSQKWNRRSSGRFGLCSSIRPGGIGRYSGERFSARR